MQAVRATPFTLFNGNLVGFFLSYLLEVVLQVTGFFLSLRL